MQGHGFQQPLMYTNQPSSWEESSLEERNCSGPKPWNALNNLCHSAEDAGVDHSLYSALPGGCIPTRVSTPWQQRPGREIRWSRLLTEGRSVANVLPLMLEEKAKQSFFPKVSRLLYLLFCVTWLSALPLCLYSFPLDMGCNNNFFHDYDVFSCHLQSLMLEGKESRWKLPARHPASCLMNK